MPHLTRITPLRLIGITGAAHYKPSKSIIGVPSPVVPINLLGIIGLLRAITTLWDVDRDRTRFVFAYIANVCYCECISSVSDK